MKPDFYFVFDVESYGLHGPCFAVGVVIIGQDGVELESFYAALKPDLNGVSADDAAFLAENVVPNLYGATHSKPADLQNDFWAKWLEWKEKGAVMVTDCGWPVEANFLTHCVWPVLAERKWQGPYPLLDLSSVLFAAGKDPAGTFERKAGETPAHNPLCDARQSARVLIETLAELGRN